MTAHLSIPRPFVPGTTGWTADDLDDPQVQRLWEQGRYEIVEGVLATMPAAYLEGSLSLKRLVSIVERHLESTGQGGEFAYEVDLVVDRRRVPRVDALYLTAADLQRQRQAQASKGRSKHKYGRVLIPPTLIIESISEGHEEHDRALKRQWYAGFQVPNYWLLDAYRRALDCLVLDGEDYRADQSGRENDELRPQAFMGLTVRLQSLWA
jgi:Uma2 family endonuclease